MTVALIELDRVEIEPWLDGLAAILVDCVARGASVNFMAPFTRADGLAFWRGVQAEVAAGRIVLLLALRDGRPVGTAQLKLQTPPNQPHRADVSKVLVHGDARRQGVARELMLALEQAALRRGRWLLTLDTVSDSAAEHLYRGLGYVAVGRIPDYALLPEGGLVPATLLYKKLG